MKSASPETQCAECIFQKQYPICTLTLQTKYQGHANHDTTFENSQQLTSGINTSTILLTGWDFIFKLCPFMIGNSSNHQPSMLSSPLIHLPKTLYSPSAMKSLPPYFMGRDTMSLLHRKILLTCIPQYLQESAE